MPTAATIPMKWADDRSHAGSMEHCVCCGRKLTGMSITTIKENIEARQEAEAIAELIGDKPERFWRALAIVVESKLPKPELLPSGDDAMTYDQAIRFEKTQVPYGKYQGNEVGEVPTEYLCWLVDGNEFTRGLRRYLKSSVFKQRQREE